MKYIDLTFASFSVSGKVWIWAELANLQSENPRSETYSPSVALRKALTQGLSRVGGVAGMMSVFWWNTISMFGSASLFHLVTMASTSSIVNVGAIRMSNTATKWRKDSRSVCEKSCILKKAKVHLSTIMYRKCNVSLIEAKMFSRRTGSRKHIGFRVFTYRVLTHRQLGRYYIRLHTSLST